jgi:hypothetical protein
MYFGMKSYLKNNRNHTAKHIKTQNDQVGAHITKTLKCLGKSLSICAK